MKRFLGIIICLLIVMMVSMGCSNLIIEDEEINVLCFGDSNTYGFESFATNGRFPLDKIWPSILQEKLGSRYNIIQEGLNGRTTAFDYYNGNEQNGLSALPTILISHKPIDLVIIMLGTNDCAKDLDVSTSDIGNGMKQLIETTKDVCKRYQGYEPKIMIITPAAIGNDLKGTSFEDKLDEESIKKSHDIASVYEDLAKEYDCIYLDNSNSTYVNKIDCIHLTLEGHADLANKVYDIVKNLKIK